MIRFYAITLMLIGYLVLYCPTARPSAGRAMPNPMLMHTAERAFNKAKAQNMHASPIMGIIDFSQPSSAKRLWIINMQQHRVLHHTWVAHGQGSGTHFATTFSNQEHSHKTAIGLYRTQSAYQGKHGLSMRLEGLETGFNDLAQKRGIVIHGATYVSKHMLAKQGRLGRSWGCFALNPKDNKTIIALFSKQPALILAYYPDPTWLKTSKWI